MPKMNVRNTMKELLEELTLNEQAEVLGYDGLDGHTLNYYEKDYSKIEEIDFGYWFCMQDEAWFERTLRWAKSLSEDELLCGAESERYRQGCTKWVEHPIDRLHEAWRRTQRDNRGFINMLKVESFPSCVIDGMKYRFRIVT